MLTISQDVKGLSCVRNDVTLRLSTDVNASGVRWGSRISFSSGNIQSADPGKQLIFTWASGAEALTFTCSETGGDGNFYPRSLFINDSAFIDGLVASLASSNQFAQFFDVSRDGIAPAILIQARYTGIRYNTVMSGSLQFSDQIQAVGADPAVDYSILLDIYEEQELNSNEFRKIIGMKLFPDAGRKFNVNLRRILENPELLPGKILPAIPPNTLARPVAVSSFLKRFYYRIHEVTSGPYLGTGSHVVSAVKYALLGGIGYDAVLQGFDLEAHLMQQYVPFLTWCPAGKLVGKDQPEFLYFLLTNAGMYDSASPATVMVDILLGNGVQLQGQEVTDFPSFNLWQPYVVPVGVFQLGLQRFLPSPEDEIAAYTVYIRHRGIRISEKREFRVDWQCPEDRQYFLFQNSLGGMDVLYTHGQEISLSVTEAIVERVGSDDIPDPTHRGRYVSASRTLHRVFTTSTRAVDKGYLRYLHEFFNSNHIFLFYKGVYIPVLLTKNSMETLKFRPDLQSITVEYRYAFDDAGYGE
ncbi:hypothetical protein [Chitinophaga rhizosphaerae]|uniref:hypothetical protein n=1 Tax=Chitinophaga rhizosphaerae TaxID=1864947 RepID=UPI000F7FD788|nr:hypothetical protein [Chitinophaga rhizosphaerae]